MQLKTYIDTTAKAVLEQIKADLGLDAVILSKREGKDEDGRAWVEMTAGIERGRSPQIQCSSASEGLQLSSPAAVLAAARQHGGFGAGALRSEPMGGAAPPGWAKWHEEWACIKEHLMALMKPALRLEQLSPRQRLAMEYLQREGVEDTVILKLYRRLLREPGASILGPLTEIVPVRPWGREAWPQQYHLIAGPSGSGKTSALIRMALQYRRANPGARVCVVNADSARTGGRMLLKHYTELSEIAYSEAATRMDWSRIFLEVARTGYDLVLVDLPSFDRNASLAAYLTELDLPGPDLSPQDMAVHIVLSPLFGRLQLSALVERYRSHLDGSIIWAKLDEALSYGALVNVSSNTGLNVSALSYGTGLRDSLAPAEDGTLWRLVFKRQLPA